MYPFEIENGKVIRYKASWSEDRKAEARDMILRHPAAVQNKLAASAAMKAAEGGAGPDADDDAPTCGTCQQPLTPRGRQPWEGRGAKYWSCGCDKEPARPVVPKSTDDTDSAPAKRNPWEPRPRG